MPTLKPKKSKRLKRPKASDRYVRIDQGYGPASHWVTGRVIESRMYSALFEHHEDSESVLVELPGGERVWADFFEEIPQPVCDRDCHNCPEDKHCFFYLDPD